MDSTIGERSFVSCLALISIDFPTTITNVGHAAFTQCTKASSVRFKPSSNKVILGDNLFEGCTFLSDVTLPEKADCISFGMFSTCKALQKLHIPAGIEEIKFLEGAAPFPRLPQKHRNKLCRLLGQKE